jgi:hypothetical protein
MGPFYAGLYLSTPPDCPWPKIFPGMEKYFRSSAYSASYHTTPKKKATTMNRTRMANISHCGFDKAQGRADAREPLRHVIQPV